MPTTREIIFTERQGYFDLFTRRHLVSGAPKAATIELVSERVGDQFSAIAARLLGLEFDPGRDTFAVEMEGAGHTVTCPTEIWVIEDDGGFISALELICSDGTRADHPSASRRSSGAPRNGAMMPRTLGE